MARNVTCKGVHPVPSRASPVAEDFPRLIMKSPDTNELRMALELTERMSRGEFADLFPAGLPVQAGRQGTFGGQLDRHAIEAGIAGLAGKQLEAEQLAAVVVLGECAPSSRPGQT